MKKLGLFLNFAFICVLGMAFVGLMKGGIPHGLEAGEDGGLPPNRLFAQKLQSDNGTLIDLHNNLTYVWYENHQVADDNYDVGDYELYVGFDGIQKLASMEEYGVTRKEQEQIIDNHSDKNLTTNDWYVLVMNRKTRKLNGVENPAEQRIVLAGFYYQDEKVWNAMNCNNASYLTLRVVE